MMRFLMNLFPIRAKTLEEFMDLVRKEGCMFVQVMPVERGLGMPGPAGCSMFIWTPTEEEVISSEYYLQFSSSTPRGRKIRYRGVRTVRYENIGIMRNHVAREQDAAKFFFAAEQNAKLLRKELPNVVVEELSNTGMPITAETRKELYRHAALYGVMPPESRP